MTRSVRISDVESQVFTEAAYRAVVQDWLASPEAERRLAEALHTFDVDNERDPADEIDEARAILAALRDQP